MLKEENDNSSILIEEPVTYNSSTKNLGIRAIFSGKNKSYKKNTLLFTPTSAHNNKFSFCNTIMSPIITKGDSIECEKNNYENNVNKKNSALIEKINISLKKDNTRTRTESSKESKNIYINDDKQLSKLYLIDMKENYDKSKEDKNKINLEKNPFFLGKPVSLNYNQLKTQKMLDLNNENSNTEKYKYSNSAYIKKETSKSLNCSKKKLTQKEDDDKSENIQKRRENLSIPKDFINKNKKKEKDKEKDKSKVLRGKSNKKKISFLIHNKMKDKDDIFKMKKDKIKSEKRRNSVFEKKCKNYQSNKCITNYYDINNENASKKNNIKENHEEKKSEKKIKKKKFQRLKTQRIEIHNNISKNLKNDKDENNEKLKNKISIKYSTIQPKKSICVLKDYLKAKENIDNNHKDTSSSNKSSREKNKHIEVDNNKRFKSKNDVVRIVLNKRESDEEKKKDKSKYNLKKGKSMEKSDRELITYLKKNDDEKEKMSTYKKAITREKSDMDNNKYKINKCLTSDLNKKRSVNVVDKYIKSKSSSGSSKKKIQGLTGINLFGKTNNKKKINIDFEFALKNNLKKTQFNLFSKDKFTNTEFTDCDYLKYTLDCMELILDIDIEKQTRLKNKINFNFPKPKKNKIKKKIALFDLDETLVHCTGDIKIQKDKYQHAINIQLPGKQAVQVGINLRPYWKQTINLIKKNYYVVIYTASHQAYADAVLDFMDPKKKFFKYRLYRNNCSLVDVDGAKFYVKDLDIFNEYYDLKDIIIVDNSVLSFAYHLHNGVPIVPYYDEDKDGSLYVVGLYLMHIFNEDDLREANKKQINLDSFMEEAKKQKEEFVDVDKIDEESDSKEEDNNEKDNTVKPLEKSKPRLSEKKILFNVKKKSSKFLYSNEQKQQNDLAQKKLMSQSKLINMYYEVIDKSKDNQIHQNKELIQELKEVQEEKEDDNKAHIIFYDNDDDCDCKSDPGLFHLEHHNLFDNSKSKIYDTNQESVLKRGLTIIEDSLLHDEKQEPKNEEENMEIHNIKSCKNLNKTKLGFIRSNFYNKFKI